MRLTDGRDLSLSYTRALSSIADELTAIRAQSVETVFQSDVWLSIWIECAADDFGEAPVLVVGREANGEVAFVLPMAVRRIYKVATLTWLGQSHFAMNMGCFTPDTARMLSRDDIVLVLNALRADGLSFDAVHLRNQPELVEGVANPMLALGRQLAANANYSRALREDYDALYCDTFNARARRNHKRQSRRLVEHGEISRVVGQDPDDRAEILETFFALKTAQLDAAGVSNPFARQALRTFYRNILVSENAPGVEAVCTALRLDGRIIATLIGVIEGRRFTTLMSAITLDDVARSSPGQHLLELTIRDLCAGGIEVFDFGPGVSTQKVRWNMEPEPLYHSYAGFTLRGQLFLLIARARDLVQRWVKQSPRVFALVGRVRTLLSGTSAPSP